MKTKILRVSVSSDSPVPEIKDHKMICHSEINEKTNEYEFIPIELDLCRGGNAVRLGDDVYKVSSTINKIMCGFKEERTNIISHMLDHPDDTGIFPTSLAYHMLDHLVFDILVLALDNEADTLDRAEAMCLESLEPKVYEKWTFVRDALKSTRSAFKNPKAFVKG